MLGNIVFLAMESTTSNVQDVHQGSARPAKKQIKKGVCETFIWSYLPWDSEPETVLS